MIFECNMNLNITMNLILLEVEYDMPQIVNGLQTIAMVQSQFAFMKKFILKKFDV